MLLVTVRGESMAPALHEGDRVLVVRRWPLRRGAIVAVRVPPAPGEEPWLWVKRAIALVQRGRHRLAADGDEDHPPVRLTGRSDDEDQMNGVPHCAR